MSVGSIAALTVLKLAFFEAIGTPTPFLLYFGAVVYAAWYGGVTAGVLATVLGGVVGNYIFIPTSFALSTGAAALAQTALFVLEGAVLTFLTAGLRDAQRRSSTAEHGTRAALDRLEAVLSGVGDGITMQDATGRLTYANDAGARMSGFDDAAAMLAAPPHEVMERFEILREDGAPLPLEELPARALLRGEHARDMTVRFRQRPSGEERWTAIRSTAQRDERGAIRSVVNALRDVTDERRAQEQLQLGREWFATALRSIGDAVITTDRRSHVTFINPVAVALTGWTAEDAVGRPLSDVFRILNEGTRATVESPVDRVLREGVVVGLANHTILVARGGHETQIDDSAAPIKTDDGELVGVVLVFRDVGAERREEARKAYLIRVTAELSSSLDFSSTLAKVARLSVPAMADWCAVDMLEDGHLRRLGVAHVDAAKVQHVEDLARRYPPDPTATTGVHNILRTGQPEFVREIPAQLLEAAAQDAEHLELIRALSLRSYIGVPIKVSGKVVGVISLVMAESNRVYEVDDLAFAETVAERAAAAIENASLYRDAERLEAEAIAQRDRLNDMIAASPSAICVLRGPDLTYEMMNEPYRVRLTDAIQLGTRLADVDTDGRNSTLVRRAYETGTPTEVSEHRVVSQHFVDEQQTRYLDYKAAPLRDRHGQVDSVVVFVDDVTEDVVTRQRLETARAEAEAASRTKDEFLAMLGHELRNPLAPIVTALDLMDFRAEQAFARERSIIERQVKHVIRLVDDLMDVSRITRGRLELSREIVAVRDVLAEALEMSASAMEERSHDVRSTLEPGLYIDGDPVRLAQVLFNLLSNASKYSEPGTRIEINAKRAGDEVVIRVRDAGIGIAPEMLARVFELFAQEPQALDRAQGGLGLGLAIVRSLVAQHGGTVTAHSEGPGKGSEFVLRFPAVRAPTPPPAEVPAPQPVTKSTRVLVVDDNPDALDMLATALEMMGHDVLRASDGPSALVIAAEGLPEIGLLDIGLPVMDGYELARGLRKLEGLSALKLVALTGYGQPSDRRAATDAGFDAHMVKPVSLDAVEDIIRRFTTAR